MGCHFSVSAPTVQFLGVSAVIPSISIGVMSPSVSSPVYVQPTLSHRFFPIDFTPSFFQLDPSQFDLNVEGVVFPVFNPIEVEEFQPFDRDVQTPRVPDRLVLPESIEDPNYDILRRRLNSFLFFYFPYSIVFPPLPISQDRRIPEFDVSLLDLNLPENELELLELPYFGSVNVRLFADVKGDFLKRLGYVNKQVEEVYRSERGFFKRLFDKVERYADSLLMIESFIMFIEQQLLRERASFVQHLTNKQRVLLRSLFTMKKYREILKFKVERLELMLLQAKRDVERIVEVNAGLYSEWRSKVGVEQARWQHYVNFIKRSASLYDMVTKTNRMLRELFLFYVGLLRYLVEGQVLNIERERLIVDSSLATLNFAMAKEREQLPNIRREVLLQLDELFNKRLEVLQKEFEALVIRSSVLRDKLDVMNKELQVTSGTLALNVDRYNLQGESAEVGGFLRLLETYLNMYRQMHSDYLTVMREYIQTMGEKQRFDIELNQVLPTLVNSVNQRIWALISNEYNQVRDAYYTFIRLHSWASTMIANANIKSTIIEAYR